MDEIYGTFPCPQCAQTIPQERLAIVDYHVLIDERTAEIDPGIFEYAKERAAMELAGQLLKNGFITFERMPRDQEKAAVPIMATVRVASPAHVATLEQRLVRARRAGFASGLEEAYKIVAAVANLAGDFFGALLELERRRKRVEDEAVSERSEARRP